MLIVVDSKSRKSGIKKYLLNGTKNDRDIKDERIPLVGNLDVLDRTVKFAENQGYKETYRNIVLTFSEDHIEVEKLQKIAKEFIKQYTTGYHENEYVAYAEIHLPKIKIDKKTGEIRKPHIHISIAKYSPELEKVLELGHHGLKSFRYGTDGREFGLWKTYIEKKYGLQDFGQKRPLKRVERQSLTRQNAAEKMLETIRENAKNVNSLNDITNLLQNEHKEIVKIEVGSEKAKTPYITVHLENENKGIRLKGELFSQSGFKEALKLLQEPIKGEIKEDLKEDLSLLPPKELIEINQKRVEYIEKRERFARKKAEERNNKEAEQIEQIHQIAIAQVAAVSTKINKINLLQHIKKPVSYWQYKILQHELQKTKKTKKDKKNRLLEAVKIIEKIQKNPAPELQKHKEKNHAIYKPNNRRNDKKRRLPPHLAVQRYNMRELPSLNLAVSSKPKPDVLLLRNVQHILDIRRYGQSNFEVRRAGASYGGAISSNTKRLKK